MANPQVEITNRNGNDVTIQSVGVKRTITQVVSEEAFQKYFKKIGDNLYEMIVDDDIQAASDRLNIHLDWLTERMPHIIMAINNPDGIVYKSMANLYFLGTIVQNYLEEFPDSSSAEFIQEVNYLRGVMREI